MVAGFQQRDARVDFSPVLYVICMGSTRLTQLAGPGCRVAVAGPLIGRAIITARAC